VCRERGRERSGCVCVRAHGSLRLRTERDSSKCDQYQRDLEGGRRRATGVRVTAARRVLAPSQGGGERCLRVRLGPARQRAGPVSLCCSQEPGSWHLPGTAPRQFTGQKRRLQPEASCCTAAGSSQLSTPFFLVFIRECVCIDLGKSLPRFVSLLLPRAREHFPTEHWITVAQGFPANAMQGQVVPLQKETSEGCVHVVEMPEWLTLSCNL